MLLVEMTRACHSDQREESSQLVENKISPAVDMTNACHSDQREEFSHIMEPKIEMLDMLDFQNMIFSL